jgi:uncharacterized membrane-anchored protein YhcB (DUF1043 family)
MTPQAWLTVDVLALFIGVVIGFVIWDKIRDL